MMTVFFMMVLTVLIAVIGIAFDKWFRDGFFVGAVVACFLIFTTTLFYRHAVTQFSSEPKVVTPQSYPTPHKKVM